jgi:ubiquinone/menaquinone biosynthesis C-methylase UbiE
MKATIKIEDKFEEKAKTYDSNHLAIEISDKFFNEVKKNVEIRNNFRLLDFGCGTGLVGLSFSSLVNSILMIDNSKAMLSLLQNKVINTNLKNIEIMEGDIEKLEIKQSSIDLIISSMTFHHIKNIPNILNILHSLLKENGCIVIGDLCKEDGNFHGLEIAEHNGFEIDEITEMFNKSNLLVKNIYKYNIINRPDKEGNMRSYDQFILVANKN